MSVDVVYYDKGNSSGRLTAHVLNLFPNAVELLPGSPQNLRWNVAFLHIEDRDFENVLDSLETHQLAVRVKGAQLPTLRYATKRGMAVNCIKPVGNGLAETDLTRVVDALTRANGRLEAGVAELYDLIPLELPYHLYAVEILSQWSLVCKSPKPDELLTAAFKRQGKELRAFIEGAKEERKKANFDGELDRLIDSLASPSERSVNTAVDLLSARSQLQKTLQISP